MNAHKKIAIVIAVPAIALAAAASAAPALASPSPTASASVTGLAPLTSCTSGYGAIVTEHGTPAQWIRTQTTGNRIALTEDTGGATNFCFNSNGTLQQANTNYCLGWNQNAFEVDERPSLPCPTGAVPSWQKWYSVVADAHGIYLQSAWCGADWNCNSNVLNLECGVVGSPPLNYFIIDYATTGDWAQIFQTSG